MTSNRTRNLGIAVGLAAITRGIARRIAAFDLEDRVALVTGGSRGLGLVIARKLVADGAKVAIVARDGEELLRARLDLEQRGGDVLALIGDVTRPEECADVVARTLGHFGSIDVLVNTAGVMHVGPMEVMSLADYEKAMATHFWGPLYMSHAVLPDMITRGGGRIVNITSIGGKIPIPHLLPYSASKFALVGFSEGLREELTRYNVFVTTVVPGLMRTGSPRNATFKGEHTQEYAWFAIGGSSHLTSMNADRAARKIVMAMRRGQPEITLSIQAKLAARLYALAPGLAQRVLSFVDRMLPEPGGIGDHSALGSESESSAAPSFFTRASDRAARANNEIRR